MITGEIMKKKIIVTKNKSKKITGNKSYSELYQDGLSDMAELFVDYYCGMCNYNGAKAARRAGFGVRSAGVTASQLLSNPYIQEAISEHKRKIKELAELKELDLLRELGKIIKGDPRLLFDDTGHLKNPNQLTETEIALIKSFDTVINSVTGAVTKKVVLSDKVIAILNYGKHIGMFVDVSKTLSPTDFEMTIVPAKKEK
ncbi:MAG: terminase small subunit [Minisyncoccales bacterium]